MAKGSRTHPAGRTFHLVPDGLLLAGGLQFVGATPPSSGTASPAAVLASPGTPWATKLTQIGPAIRGNATNPAVYVPLALGLGAKAVSGHFRLGTRTHVFRGLSIL